ncbi:MAG: hypothetical protein ACLVJH_19650 [Faecalibacterium prausnitzii]
MNFTEWNPHQENISGSILALVVSEEAMILNANWFGLELPFRYYPCWLECLDWPMGYVYDPLNFERQDA